MKKTVKRILCGVLSGMLVSTLALESSIRLNADESLNLGATGTSVSSSAAFKNVTGQFDTSSIRESQFASSVQENATPTYETRTVIVELSGETVADKADGANVDEYINTWSGQRTTSSIASEQQAFLRSLEKKGIPYTKKSAYNAVLNGVAIEINTKYVSQIKQMAGVKSVVIGTSYSEPQSYSTSSTSAVSNETNIYSTGIYDSSAYAQYGSGSVVAILDTGLDYTHPAFQGFKTEGTVGAWSKTDVANKINAQNLSAESLTSGLSVSDVYVSEKVPFAYDYADSDTDVYPSYSNHGTHVAGIIGGYHPSSEGDAGYTDKDGNPVYEDFIGVVPDAQLVICKVFTDDLDSKNLGSAETEYIVAALDDCVKLGVDVINMSLGTSAGFTTTDDGDEEGELLNDVYTRIQDAGISLVCAASNEYSAGYGGVYGTNLTSNPDSGTVGSPSTFSAALSVASIDGKKARYFVANNDDESARSYVFYEESRDLNSNPYDFLNEIKEKTGKAEFEYVVVPGIGQNADYATIRSLFKDSNGNSLGRVALIKRGDTSFQDKVELAAEMGAVGVIIHNNVSGTIRMNLGEIEAEKRIPAISITKSAGETMVSSATGRVGKISLDDSYQAGPFMSEFSSWGPTHDLKLKPEITAHGGEITSAVPGGYGEQSGTSMASPNMAGVTAIVRNYVKEQFGLQGVELNNRVMQLIMSTAGLVYDQEGLAYSPRKQGAGVAKLENIMETRAFLWTEQEENLRPKLELGDDPNRTGEYEMTFKLTNFGDSALTFSTNQLVMTETLTKTQTGLFQTVAEQAYMLNDSVTAWSVNGSALNGGNITVAANETAEISVTLKISDEAKAYIDESFENGMYVEGFLQLQSTSTAQCDLNIPFLAFYGNWEDAPMLDYSAFEIAKEAQDASVKEEDKIQASTWATQPYTSYYNEEYILPMGGYCYVLGDDDEPVYDDEEKCAVSRYNVYYGEDKAGNYMSSTSIKAVYAGLMRNARIVKYKMYNLQTGELVYEDKDYRVAKSYAGGGSAVPAYVELELSPEELGLAANGMYRMDLEFYMTDPDLLETPITASEDNTFSFSFTVDYDAPILEDVRVRYYNYKEDNKDKQRIYLDLDVFDNHYAQAIMLCYPTTNDDGDIVLQLATEHAVPVRDGNKNGTTTVSIEITDIYEKYGSQLYVQLDDYALNNCIYQIDINNANAGVLPEGNEFDFADGESDLTLDIYETHKVSLVYGASYTGSADLSNFQWLSKNPSIADVKNGEIVGLGAGTTEILVSNRKGVTKTLRVTVTEQEKALPSVPNISFGLIKTSSDAVQKATGTVSVSAGKTYTLEVETDPWYYPENLIRFNWKSMNEAVATVDQSGNVSTLKKGSAPITATMEKWTGSEWKNTGYAATVTLKVANEFTVSGYTLTEYNGTGGDVVIPTDLNIMYIGNGAFKNNTNITSIVIPSSVMEIKDEAFLNCSALEEVYFVSKEKQAIADADVSMIYDRVFANCTKLRKVDFSNVKTVTIGRNCFAGDTALQEVVDMPSIGTMHNYAFYGCTSLRSADLTGLHMSGSSVFEDCTSLAKITTGKFTAIGTNMFKNCTALRNKLTLYTPKIGDGAFYGCVNLSGVELQSPEGETLAFSIGKEAFFECGKNLKSGKFSFTFGDENILSIGERAFASSALTTLAPLNGLQSLGANAFANTKLTTVQIGEKTDWESLQVLGVPFVGLTVTIADGSTRYTEENGIIYNADKTKVLHVNPSVTGEVQLPTTITEIGAYAFASSNATKVKASANLKKIGDGAFCNSEIVAIDWNGAALTEIPQNAFNGARLTQVALPDTVTKIGAYAFANSALSGFTANGVTEIGDGAFESCVALQTISLPETLQTMGDGVFAKCSALKTVNIPSLTKLGMSTFSGATALESVTFGENVSTTGVMTFANSPVREVVLGGAVESVGIGAFYNAEALTTIALPDGVHTVEMMAFAGTSALQTVVGIERVQTFEEYAFYNSGITELNLTEAVTIGDYAFAAQKANGEAAYTVVAIPNAKTIGDFAFLNGMEESVVIGSNVRHIGSGAFASSSCLKAFTVDGNSGYFVEDGVLYRYVDEAKSEYAAVAYPAAYARVDGDTTIALKEGTVYVEAFAFHGLNAGSLKKAVLPYSLASIGDGAFYESGIYEYTFESIQAPRLETSYRSEVENAVLNLETNTPYRGYYYTNFETYIFNFTDYIREENKLIMNYPVNGVGYDNYIYCLYFGTRNVTEILPEDETRECIDLIQNVLPSAAEVETWTQLAVTDENKAMVMSVSDNVKAARQYYNNAMKKDGQQQFISDELAEKLTAVEKALRTVKARFGIVSKISSVSAAESSTHKTEYTVGETFDMTGLVVEIVYDDYSTEIADASQLTLVTGALGKYDRYVVVRYNATDVNGNAVEEEVRIMVTIKDASSNSGDVTSSDSSVVDNSENEKGNKTILIIGGCVLGAAVLGILVAVAIKSATKSKAQRAEKAAKKAEKAAQESFLKVWGNYDPAVRADVVIQTNEPLTPDQAASLCDVQGVVQGELRKSDGNVSAEAERAKINITLVTQEQKIQNDKKENK